MSVCLNMYLCSMCVQCLQRPGEGVRSPSYGATVISFHVCVAGGEGFKSQSSERVTSAFNL